MVDLRTRGLTFADLIDEEKGLGLKYGAVIYIWLSCGRQWSLCIHVVM